MTARHATLVLGALAALVLTGCAADPARGYSTKPLEGETLRSVHVELFDNRTREPGLEAELTEMVIKEIQRTTGFAVTDAGSATSTLSGSIDRYRGRRLSVQRGTGFVEELMTEVTVSFTWRDNLSGDLLAGRDRLLVSSASAPSAPARERIAVGRNETLNELAAEIVREMRDDW
ncbi:MAG: LptE family protein [Planctomycetota bacterium]